MLNIKSLNHNIEQLRNIDDFIQYLNNNFFNIKLFFQSKRVTELNEEKFDLERLLYTLEDNKLISKNNHSVVDEFLILIFYSFEIIQFKSAIRTLKPYLSLTKVNYQVDTNIKFLNINNSRIDYHNNFNEIMMLLEKSLLMEDAIKTLLLYFLVAMKSFTRIKNKELEKSFKYLFLENKHKYKILNSNIIENLILETTIENINLKYNEIVDKLYTNNLVELFPNKTLIQDADIVKIKFKPTEEQSEIIETSKEMKQGQVLIIEALAGCTKTSTLEMITKKHTKSKFLYLAFNKKIVEDAKSRFPSNTEVKTLHALAFKYKERDKSIASNREINNIISKLFDLNISKDFYKINDIHNIYNKFCGSESSIDELNKLEKRLIDEIIQEYKNKAESEQYKKKFFIDKIKYAMPYISRLWEYMEDSNFTTHSTYLKAFVEDNYTLEYDFIILDESQDVSRVLGKFIITSIISSKYKVIVVGDNNQKIYGFLGNINLSKSIKKIVDNTIYIEKNLTKTFRFSKNSSIENLTNLILELRDIKIIGAKIEKERDTNEKNLTIGYLSRGKLPVLGKALEFLKEDIDFNLFMSIKQDFEISILIDIYNLYRYTMMLKNDLVQNKQINISKLEKCVAPYNKIFNEDIIDTIEKFKDKKQNDIFPKFINKRFNKISSFYQLEYEAYKNQSLDTLDNIKICYFIILNFNFFNTKETKVNYNHIVEKSLFLLVEEFSNENSSNIISTIHKVKGLEYEKVTLISPLSILRKINIISDDNIELSLGQAKIMGLCCPQENNNCIKIKPKKNISPSIDFSNIFDTKTIEKKFTLDKALKDNNKTFDTLIIDKNMDTQEEYNILYVGITRAKETIIIENLIYDATLTFLKFLNENREEVNKIINNKNSKLLIAQDKEYGIVYTNKYFISIKVLKDFMFQFKNYN